MSKRQQSYRNNGFKKLLISMYATMSSFYNTVFHNNRRNTGKAGGHLDNSYHSGGNGYGKSTKMPIEPHKAKIEKKRRRKEIDKSKRINRKRANGVCSYKAKA